MAIIKKNPELIGMVCAFASALTWVFGAIFISNIYKAEVLSQITDASLPLAVSFLYGAFGVIFIFLFLLITKRKGELVRSLRMKSSTFLWLSGIFGGPIALSFFCMALLNLDPAYVMPITSAYPVLCAFLAVLFLGERISKISWYGIIICICGAMIVGITPPSGQTSGSFYLGIIFAVGVSFAWSLEGVFASKAFDFFDPYVATAFRFLAYLIICPTIILPLLGGFEYITLILEHAWRFLLLASFCSVVNCIFYYVAINYIGSGRASAITSSYSIFSILGGLILGSVDITYMLIIGGIILFLGLLIIVKGANSASFRQEENVIKDVENKNKDRKEISQLPLKVAIVRMLDLSKGQDVEAIYEGLKEHYVRDDLFSKKHLISQLNSMKMAGLITNVRNQEDMYLLTISGYNKVMSLQ